MKLNSRVMRHAELRPSPPPLVAALVLCLLLAACGGGDLGDMSLPPAAKTEGSTSVLEGAVQKAATGDSFCNKDATVDLAAITADPCDSETALESLAASGTARLAWSPTPDPDVKGYRIYYGTASRAYNQTSGAGLEAGNVSTYSVPDLMRGQTYYFAVTAVDSAGRESEFSDEVARTIP